MKKKGINLRKLNKFEIGGQKSCHTGQDKILVTDNYIQKWGKETKGKKKGGNTR